MSKVTFVTGPDALELGVARTDDVTERGNVWEQLSLSKEVLSQGCLWKRKRSVVPSQASNGLDAGLFFVLMTACILSNLKM